jgi:acyl-CoA reductase-like NAD-dependent aldehyde dehydrogenase
MKHLKMYIAGKWVHGEGGKTFDAISPATGEVFATLPMGTREDARRAIKAANEAREKFAFMSVWERSALCGRIADELERRKEDVARILAQDQGKVYHTEALGEVGAAVAGFREAGEIVRHMETSVVPAEASNKLVMTLRQPRGVYAVITPWNFPVNIPVEYIAPGLATGNAIVWNPASSTSAVAVALMECMEAAGVPAGVMNLVTGPGSVVGDEMVSNAGTHAIGFTGSSEVGETIGQRAPLKPMLLELGGNGPAIVLDDADLDRAAECISFGSYFVAGQTCAATERVLVHRRAHDALVERLVNIAKKVQLGDPFDPKTTMGPLNNEPTAEKMDHHVADAASRGAKVLFGGRRAPGFPTNLYYEPTVIDNVPVDALANKEETFGPIVPIITFSSYEEAVTIANDTSLGLSSAVFGEDLRKATWVAERLRTGIVNINDATTYWELHIPFGGGTGMRSGIGRLGGKNTIREMTVVKTITMDLFDR